MHLLIKRVIKRGIVVILLGVAISVFAITVYYFANRPTADIREIQTLQAELSYAKSKAFKQTKNSKSKGEKAEAVRQYEASNEVFASRFLQVSEKYPHTSGELAALIWVACKTPDSDAGRRALAALEARVNTASLDQFERAIKNAQAGDPHRIQSIAPGLLNRIKQSPDHRHAAFLLSEVCVMSNGDPDSEQPGEYFAEAAALIAEQYADSPDIGNFCWCLGNGLQSPSWGGGYERHLRKILNDNEDRWVRCAALMALGTVVESFGQDRQAEAEQLYQQFVDEFDGQHRHHAQGIEKQYRRLAEDHLDEIRLRGIGMKAPDIAGADLAGRSMKLSDFRGKVVLLSFWATWCIPCMEMIPHERALAERLQDAPFVIVGVNGDTDDEAIREACTEHRISWRSFRDDSAGAAERISNTWGVMGWPTLYLIDQNGIIRKRWLGTPAVDELNRKVDALVLGSVDTQMRAQSQKKFDQSSDFD